MQIRKIAEFLSEMAQKEQKSVDQLLHDMLATTHREPFQAWLKEHPPKIRHLDITQEISHSPEIKQILDYVVRNVTLYLPASVGSSIILWSDQQKKYLVSTTSVPGQPPHVTSTRIRRQQGATRWIIDNQQSLVVGDVQSDPFGANPMIVQYGVQSYIGVPLLHNDQSLGVLYALNNTPHAFSEKEISLMHDMARIVSHTITQTIVANQLAEANENLHAYAHMVAHDLKSPLSTLYGFSQLALEDIDDQAPSIQASFNDIHRLVQNTFRIIDDLLLLADLNSQQDALHEDVDLLVLLKEAKSELHYVLQEHDCAVDLPQNIIVLVGHPVWYKQLLKHLMQIGLNTDSTLSRIQVEYELLDQDIQIEMNYTYDDQKVDLTWAELSDLNKTRPISFEHGIHLSIAQRIIDKMKAHMDITLEGVRLEKIQCKIPLQTS